MASSYKDSSPNAGAKKGGGMKNNDGRIDGHKYDKQDKAKGAGMSSKETFSPNDDVKSLPGRTGKEEGAY